MIDRFRTLLQSAGMRHALVMSAATFLAGGLDYLFQIYTGRMLTPADYGVFIAVTALLQVAVYLTNSIRNVMAYYTAEMSLGPDAQAQAGRFLRQGWVWAWRWGVVALALTLLVSPLVKSFLRLPTGWPMVAAALTMLLLFLRPITDGTLQGIQFFGGLGSVQVVQAGMRLVLGAVLLMLGWQAFGALMALPLAMAVALVLALSLLRRLFRAGDRLKPDRAVSWNYSLLTLAGLLFFALIINLDAIAVKRAFSPEFAGYYGPVVTLAKMNLFIPLAMGLVLFPKVTQRQAAGRDPRPILLLALAAATLPGLLLTALFLLFPGPLVEALFGGAYADPGLLLGVVGLATTCFAGMNIWLNYALSAERPAYVAALGGVLAIQVAGLLLFHESLMQIGLVTLGAGLLGNLAGAATTLGVVAGPQPIRYT